MSEIPVSVEEVAEISAHVSSFLTSPTRQSTVIPETPETDGRGNSEEKVESEPE